MTVYIPKMLRLLNEAQRNILGNLDGQKKRTSLEAPASQSMAAINAGRYN
jgi:hypothetical protein